MKKTVIRLITLLLCACLLCGSAAAYTIIDVDEDLSFSEELKEKEAVSSWAKAEIDAARAAGLITEHTGEYITRATTRFQFAELIVNLTEKVTGETITPAPIGTFTDCDELAVRKAYAAGIVNGMTADTFAPDATTNREQIATMIYRAICYIEEKAGPAIVPNSADLTGFTDKDTVSSWALEGVGRLAANNIMRGDSATTLSPKKSCTVEQSILLIYRVFTAC